MTVIPTQIRPTEEEEKVIVELNRGVAKAVECREFFDVYDEQDAEEEGVDFKPSICAENFRRSIYLLT